MRMRVLTTKLRVEIENEMRVFLESLNFEIEMRVSQKSAVVEYLHTDQSISCILLTEKNIALCLIFFIWILNRDTVFDQKRDNAFPSEHEFN